MIIGIICYSHHDFNGYIAPRHHYICLHNWETIGLNITQTLSRIMSTGQSDDVYIFIYGLIIWCCHKLHVFL